MKRGTTGVPFFSDLKNHIAVTAARLMGVCLCQLCACRGWIILRFHWENSKSVKLGRRTSIVKPYHRFSMEFRSELWLIGFYNSLCYNLNSILVDGKLLPSLQVCWSLKQLSINSNHLMPTMKAIPLHYAVTTMFLSGVLGSRWC